jgi:hypothetical protein
MINLIEKKKRTMIKTNNFPSLSLSLYGPSTE